MKRIMIPAVALWTYTLTIPVLTPDSATMAFLEYGIVMLASVLHSQRAITVNIQIVRAFMRMREILNSQNIVISRLKEVETGQMQQGERISLIFQLLEEMDEENEKRLEHQNRMRVGFKRADEQN